jgi:hypothetical protein
MSLTLGGGPTVGRLGFGAMRPPRRREHWLCIADTCLRFRIGVTQRKRVFGATHVTAHVGLGLSSRGDWLICKIRYFCIADARLAV